MTRAPHSGHAPSASPHNLSTISEPGEPAELRNNPAFTNMLNGARQRIYQAWLPHVSPAEARAEADAFARRFHVLVDGPLAPLTADEFEAVLDVVADAMADA